MLSLATGCVVAVFLIALDLITKFRFAQPWLIFLLPLAGLLIHWIYKTIGQSAERGNDLIIDEIHQPSGLLTWKMAPLILISTLLTHLFGGSAGREGTAVQMGGSIASLIGKCFKCAEKDTKMLLIAGIAAGFGAVFGTPFTGALFAIEVLSLGRLPYKYFPVALLASLLANFTVICMNVPHTVYHLETVLPDFQHIGQLAFHSLLLLKVILAAIAFGMVSWIFVQLQHQLKAFFQRTVRQQWLIPVIGGLLIIGITLILARPDYLGLGVESAYPGAYTLPGAFTSGGSGTWSWFWKMIYTTITLSTGFKGGEVTPLFYIGATLGNTLAELLHAPASLFAAIGFIAVFSGATKTPIACTVMGFELFGLEFIIFFATGCLVAYWFSGKKGIYVAQRRN